LPELICESPTQFVDKAIHLAQNPQELQVFRKHLQQHKYHLPAFDTDVWVRDFEAAMVIMCDRFLSSQPIQAIEVPAERQEGQDNENTSFLKLFPTTEKIRKGKDPED